MPPYCLSISASTYTAHTPRERSSRQLAFYRSRTANCNTFHVISCYILYHAALHIMCTPFINTQKLFLLKIVFIVTKDCMFSSPSILLIPHIKLQYPSRANVSYGHTGDILLLVVFVRHT